MPEDQALLAAFGEIALRHEHMNHILKMTIKTLAGITPAEALAATKYESSRQLRDRIKRLARKTLGEGATLLKLQALVHTCEALTEKRNNLVHGFWAKQLKQRVSDRCYLPMKKGIAGNGNRTRMASLEGWNFTIKLCPRL